MKNTFLFIFITILSLTILTSSAEAHVTVKPSEVAVGTRQIFSVSVPTEKDNPTVGLKLIIPGELTSVRPNAKAGWNIEVKKTGEGENAKVTEIEWTNGAIPADLRDDFLFSAQAPAKEAKIIWKAYQTYEDGTVVSWDQEPKRQESDEEGDTGPYSQTKVINDLKNNPPTNQPSTQDNFSMILSVVAIALSAAAFARMQSYKK